MTCLRALQKGVIPLKKGIYVFYSHLKTLDLPLRAQARPPTHAGHTAAGMTLYDGTAKSRHPLEKGDPFLFN
jgi:hypothetical protein